MGIGRTLGWFGGVVLVGRFLRGKASDSVRMGLCCNLAGVVRCFGVNPCFVGVVGWWIFVRGGLRPVVV